MADLAENIVEKTETQDLLEQEEKDKKETTVDTSKLTAAERKKIEKGEKSRQDIVAEREQYKAAAEAELKKLVTTNQDEESVIDLKEYKNLNRQLEDTKSAEEMAGLLDKIKDIPRQKEKELARKKEEAEELDPNDPKLLKLQHQFDQICDKNKHLIGGRELPGFKAWFAKERQKNPTIAHLNEQIRRLEGKEIYDHSGLAPRRQEFHKLEQLFQKHGISNPLESDYIKAEGLSERQVFRKNAEALEKHFDNVRDTGFYSKEVIQKTMQKILKAKSTTDQKALLTTTKNISKKESETFTHLDSKITIGPTTIRKMSEKSKKLYLDYYKNTDFQERETLVSGWKKLVENEASLAKDLEKIYKDNPEGLKLALGSFEELDFKEKEKALKEHQKLVEKSEKKEELEKILTIKAAEAKIDAATTKKIISSKSREKWKKWFNSEKAEIDPATGKKTGLEALKKNYEILISNAPNREFNNIATYKFMRDKFTSELRLWRRENPDVKEEAIKKWQDKYDIETSSGRKKTYKDFLKEKEETNKEYRGRKSLEKNIGVKETVEIGENIKETIKKAQELMLENQNEEALVTLETYWLANHEHLSEEENNEINFWKKVAIDKIKEFGRGKRFEDTTEKEMEEELKHIAESDEEIRDDLEEQNIITLNIEGAKLSEERHQKKVKGRDRAKQESMQQGDEQEKELTEDFYEGGSEEFILDEEGKGEKIEEIKFQDAEMTDQKRQQLKEKTRKKQSRLYKKEGFTHIKMQDKTGRQISTQEAEAEQKQDLEQVKKDMLEKAEKKVGSKKGAEIVDLNARIAGERKAREIIEKERHRKDKLKAA